MFHESYVIHDPKLVVATWSTSGSLVFVSLDWFKVKITGNPIFNGKNHGFVYIDFPLNQSNDMMMFKWHQWLVYRVSLNPMIFPLDAVREWLQKSKSLTTRRKSRVSLTGDLRLCRRIFSAVAGDFPYDFTISWGICHWKDEEFLRNENLPVWICLYISRHGGSNQYAYIHWLVQGNI